VSSTPVADAGVFADHMAQAAGSALDAWSASGPNGHPLELAEEILHIGLDTVGRALVGHDFTEVFITKHTFACGSGRNHVLRGRKRAGRCVYWASAQSAVDPWGLV
jgi:hypothetical protein